MKILHVVRSGAFYGVERYIATLARAQAQLGDDVVVVGGNRSAMRAGLESSGVGYRPGDTIAKVMSGLWATTRSLDVIHAHMTDAELASCLVGLAPRHRTPIVVTRHFASHRGSSLGGRILSPHIARRISGEIAISRFVANRVEGPTEVIFPGVPRPGTSAGSRRQSVLIAQRLEAEKATELALAAFHASELASEGWTLEIAGSGALQAHLELTSRELGIAPSVTFHGQRNDVPAMMSSCAMLLATAPAEPFGLTVVEAMAAGLPVVATASGGHLETLPEEALRYGFAPGDATAAGAGLRALARDNCLRDELARVGRERHASCFTPEAQALKTRTFYLKVLGGTNGKPKG